MVLTRRFTALLQGVPGLVGLGLALGATPAVAQITNSVLKPVAVPSDQGNHSDRLPPGLPGAQSNPQTVAPADRIPTDMQPTQALFDAINRGDIQAARDALGRGADLNGHDVLGLTPIELSIDLGRNDISFLLLSMRGSGSEGGGPPPAAVAQAQAQAQHGQKGKPAAQLRAARDERRVPTPAKREEVAAAAPQYPTLYSGNGGTPAPQVGFLGFDSNHAH
jgi:hypothetical protein